MLVTTPLSLTEYFRDIRKQKGLTQIEVAELAGLRQKDVSAFENGKLDVRLSTLRRLFSAVGISMSLEDSTDVVSKLNKDSEQW